MYKTTSKLGVIVAAALIVIGCSTEKCNKEEACCKEAQPKVERVILMIGDGMGLTHASTAWVKQGGSLEMMKFPYIGLSTTHCADHLITDSAAAGTALATGNKTNKGSVGVGTNGESLKTIVEYAKEGGLSTGVVSTCRLVDATPATFSVESIDRDEEEFIAKEFINSNVDFVLGGGLQYFNKRKDGADLLPELEKAGYKVALSVKEVDPKESSKIFALVADKDMGKPNERGDEFWRGSKKALDYLNKNEKGFFVMLEGSMIDDYGHFNDLPTLMSEIIDFDTTVGRVKEWAAAHPGTLVIVTADHETGGLTLLEGSIKDGTVEGNFSSGGHSGVMVPVYAFGTGAENFTGVYDNTDIFNKIKSLLNL